MDATSSNWATTHTCNKLQVRAHELVNSSKSDLQSKLQELKQELLQLRVQKITGGNTARLTKMCVPCKDREREDSKLRWRTWDILQCCCPPWNRPRSYRHQLEATPKPTRVLQEEAIPTPRPPPKEDPRTQEEAYQGGLFLAAG